MIHENRLPEGDDIVPEQAWLGHQKLFMLRGDSVVDILKWIEAHSWNGFVQINNIVSFLLLHNKMPR